MVRAGEGGRDIRVAQLATLRAAVIAVSEPAGFVRRDWNLICFDRSPQKLIAGFFYPETPFFNIYGFIKRKDQKTVGLLVLNMLFNKCPALFCERKKRTGSLYLRRAVVLV